MAVAGSTKNGATKESDTTFSSSETILPLLVLTSVIDPMVAWICPFSHQRLRAIHKNGKTIVHYHPTKKLRKQYPAPCGEPRRVIHAARASGFLPRACRGGCHSIFLMYGDRPAVGSECIPARGRGPTRLKFGGQPVTAQIEASAAFNVWSSDSIVPNRALIP